MMCSMGYSLSRGNLMGNMYISNRWIYFLNFTHAGNLILVKICPPNSWSDKKKKGE